MLEFLLSTDAKFWARMIGLTGFVFYIASFAGLQFGYLDGNGMLYSTLNIFAASFVLVSLSVDFNLASALIQVSWIAIGFVGLFRRLRKSAGFHFQPS